jgi:hypothetical protein
LIVGMVKGLIICGAVLVFLRYHPVLRIDRAIGRSFLYPFLERMVLALVSLLPDRVAFPLYRILGIVV